MGWVGGNRFLSMEEMKENATYIWGVLGNQGWSLNAVCGMLGNMQSESSINPSIWQNLDDGNLSLGYGLVQWTPATKYFNWCDQYSLPYGDMDSNLKRINWEVENNEQWIATTNYPFSFQAFKISEMSPYELAMAFLVNYERPADKNQPNRGTQADFWWTYLEGTNPPNPPDPPTKQRKLPLYFYLRRL